MSVSNSKPPVAEYAMARAQLNEEADGVRTRRAPRNRREKSKWHRQVSRQIDAQCAAHAINNLLQDQRVVFDWRRRMEEAPAYYNMASAVARQNDQLAAIGLPGHDVGDRYGNMLISVVEQTIEKLRLRHLKFTVVAPNSEEIGETILDDLAIRVLEEQDGFLGFFVPHMNPRMQSLHYNVFRHDPRVLRTKKDRTEDGGLKVTSEITSDRYVFIDSLDKPEIGHMVNLGVYTREQMFKYFQQRCYTEVDDGEDDEEDEAPARKKSGRSSKRNGFVLAVFAA